MAVPATPELGKNFLPGFINEPHPIIQPNAIAHTFTHAETTKMKVLEFLAKVNGTDPSSFTSQYEDAMQDEEERA